nr:MAG TPA: hypothetical protein [Bacteriophage sp.]
MAGDSGGSILSGMGYSRNYATYFKVKYYIIGPENE